MVGDWNAIKGKEEVFKPTTEKESLAEDRSNNSEKAIDFTMKVGLIISSS